VFFDKKTDIYAGIEYFVKHTQAKGETMKSKAIFFSGKYSYLDFNNTNGTIRYDSDGKAASLTKEETKQFFLSMVNFYRATDSEFYNEAIGG